MTKKSLLSQLRELANNYEHQKALLKNKNCLCTLVSMLSSKDDEIVLLAIDTLYTCSKKVENRAALCEVPQLLDTLWTLSIEHSSPKVRYTSGRMVFDLDCESSSSDSCASSVYLSSFTSRSRSCTKLNVITLEVDNIKSGADREKFYYDAVQFSGIVSVTIRSDMRRATLYTTEPYIQDPLMNYLRCKG